MKKFWNWKNKKIVNQETNEERVERILELYGTIAQDSWFEDDVTPQMFKDELNADSGDITVWINSPGGDCIAAAQIYNMLANYKGKVTVKIDGIAASAASVIAMAGSTVLMSPVSMMMIHNPVTGAFGDHIEMEKAIEMLDGVKESIINAYTLKTKMSRNKLSKLMDNETWMDAKKAIELGFADDMIKNAESTDEIVSEPVLFLRKEVNMALCNKLTSHYKKPVENNNQEINQNGVSAKDVRARLDVIKKFI